MQTDRKGLSMENAQRRKTPKQLKEWEREKKLIPVMIKKYCRGRHKSERKEENIPRGGVCAGCKELTDYALFRLEKCPFKVDKKFCSFCKVHCYKPDMREKIKAVMKYSGPGMLFSHPLFAVSHVVQMIGYKRRLKKDGKSGG